MCKERQYVAKNSQNSSKDTKEEEENWGKDASHDDGDVRRLDFDQQLLIQPNSMNMTHILALDLCQGFSFQHFLKIFCFKDLTTWL